VYGLKQSSRNWNDKVHHTLIEMGYKKSDYESCVYFKITGERMVIIAVYVDDFFVFFNDLTEVIHLKEKLMGRFQMKDLGEVSHFLGMRVTRDRCKNTIKIDQRQYIVELLKRFGLENAKTALTPIEVNLKLDSSSNPENNFPYQNLIGSLLYISVCSRPDIMFAVNFLSRFNVSYSKEHWEYAKRVLRYLKRTIDLGLVYSQNKSEIVGYVDADWADDASDRRSYTGYVFMYAGAAVSWECRKQRTVALSSTEAEYMAISDAAKEAVYLKGLVGELLGNCGAINIYNDNQSAQKIATNPVFHNRTKHIDVRHHFVREVVSNEQVNLMYLTTSEMIADVMTKGLNSAKHISCVQGLGVH
jgi:hypothetical protein